MTEGSLRKLGAALIVIGAALLVAGFRSPPMPAAAYTYTSVVQVSKPEGMDASLDDAVREESNLLESSALVEGVISNLNLTAKWSKPNETMTLNRAIQRLSSNVRVGPSDRPGQILVHVSGADKAQTDEIAHSVLRVYLDVRKSHFRQSKPKSIVTLEEQLEDLEPRLQQAIETMRRVGKELTIADVYEPPKNEPTLLDRIREGKEDEGPDTTTSTYGNEVIPKNETPEQAKRRIYLRAMRVADVLSLRKERIDARLAIERSRTATPAPTIVQVIQQPQLDETPTAPKSRSNRGWLWAGGACLIVGLVSLRRKPA